MEQQLRGLQQWPWWGGGGHGIWGARSRWRGIWDDGPERPSHSAVCMQRPRGRVRGGRIQGGELGGGGSWGHALLLDVCFLNHWGECVITSRNESPAMSNRCMMPSALASDMHMWMLPFVSGGILSQRLQKKRLFVTAEKFGLVGYHFQEKNYICPWNSSFHNTLSLLALGIVHLFVYIYSFHVCWEAKSGKCAKSL